MTQNTTPFVSPIMALFRSRKFILTFVGVLLDLVIVLLPVEVAPRIAAMREELVTAISVLIAVAVGGIAIEDSAKSSADGKVAVAQIEAGQAMTPKAYAAPQAPPTPPVSSPESPPRSINQF